MADQQTTQTIMYLNFISLQLRVFQSVSWGLLVLYVTNVFTIILSLIVSYNKILYSNKDSQLIAREIDF